MAVNNTGAEGQLNTKRLIFDRHATVVVGHGDRIFATSKEAGFLTAERCQVRLCKRAHHVLGFERLKENAECNAAYFEADTKLARCGVVEVQDGVAVEDTGVFKVHVGRTIGSGAGRDHKGFTAY